MEISLISYPNLSICKVLPIISLIFTSTLSIIPPVVMERPEKELKQLSLHIRGGALWRHTQTLKPSGSHSQPGPRAAKRPERCLLTASSVLAFHPHSRPVKPPVGQQFKRGVLRQRHGRSRDTECLGRCQGALFLMEALSFL